VRVCVISPGITESELAESISDEQARDAMQGYRAFAIAQPPEVAVNEMIVRPAASTH
jgi:NADP-dependent 3-hydroxy acid dehydrogenase YdfG